MGASARERAGLDLEAAGASLTTFPLSPTAVLHAHGPIFLVADAQGSLPPYAAQLFKAAGRQQRQQRLRRGWLQTLLLAALVVVSLVSFFEPHLRVGLEVALARARSGGAPLPLPARDLDFPVQACCIGQQCVSNSRGRHAVVTHVRSQREVTQLQVGEEVAGRRLLWVLAAVKLASKLACGNLTKCCWCCCCQFTPLRCILVLHACEW